MTITIIKSDPYLAQLTDQAKALDAREANLAAREEQLQADRLAITQDRAKLDVAKQHYEAFLAANRKTTAPTAAEGGGVAMHRLTGSSPIPLGLRMGAKRRQVLDEVATAANGLTTREISERTNVILDVVRNIVAAEIKIGVFARHDERIVMTPAGLDFLNRASAKFGPTNKKTPQSGVFQ